MNQQWCFYKSVKRGCTATSLAVVLLQTSPAIRAMGKRCRRRGTNSIQISKLVLLSIYPDSCCRQQFHIAVSDQTQTTKIASYTILQMQFSNFTKLVTALSSNFHNANEISRCILHSMNIGHSFNVKCQFIKIIE